MTAEAALVVSDPGCGWDGPHAVDVRDVVRVTVTNDEPASVGASTFVTGSNQGDLIASGNGLRASEYLGVTDVPPGGTAVRPVHIHSPGTWSFGCFGTGDDFAPAVVLQVE